MTSKNTTALDTLTTDEHTLALAAPCTRCKADVNAPCTWGTTHAAGKVHKARIHTYKAQLKATVADMKEKTMKKSTPKQARKSATSKRTSTTRKQAKARKSTKVADGTCRRFVDDIRVKRCGAPVHIGRTKTGEPRPWDWCRQCVDAENARKKAARASSKPASKPAPKSTSRKAKAAAKKVDPLRRRNSKKAPSATKTQKPVSRTAGTVAAA